MTMRSWTLVMVPLFSVSDPLSVKLTIFKIWPYLKLSIFLHQLIWPNSLYFGNPEDSGYDVGGLFCSQSDADFESRNRFRIGASLKFFVPCHSLTYFWTSITSVTLRNRKFLSIQFWSLSDLVSENRVRFARSIK